jgi:hypothetical protein
LRAEHSEIDSFVKRISHLKPRHWLGYFFSGSTTVFDEPSGYARHIRRGDDKGRASRIGAWFWPANKLADLGTGMDRRPESFSGACFCGAVEHTAEFDWA